MNAASAASSSASSVFAVDNVLGTYFFRSKMQPAYVGLAHEKRWCEVSHIVGIVLSTINYSQFIIDAHAALVAGMMGVFYFDRAKKKTIRLAANSTLKGRCKPGHRLSRKQRMN